MVSRLVCALLRWFMILLICSVMGIVCFLALVWLSSLMLIFVIVVMSIVCRRIVSIVIGMSSSVVGFVGCY